MGRGGGQRAGQLGCAVRWGPWGRGRRRGQEERKGRGWEQGGGLPLFSPWVSEDGEASGVVGHGFLHDFTFCGWGISSRTSEGAQVRVSPDPPCGEPGSWAFSGPQFLYLLGGCHPGLAAGGVLKAPCARGPRRALRVGSVPHSIPPLEASASSRGAIGSSSSLLLLRPHPGVLGLCFGPQGTSDRATGPACGPGSAPAATARGGARPWSLRRCVDGGAPRTGVARTRLLPAGGPPWPGPAVRSPPLSPHRCRKSCQTTPSTSPS